MIQLIIYSNSLEKKHTQTTTEILTSLSRLGPQYVGSVSILINSDPKEGGATAMGRVSSVWSSTKTHEKDRDGSLQIIKKNS